METKTKNRPVGSPESAARCNTRATRAHASTSILELLTLMPFRPLGRIREQAPRNSDSLESFDSKAARDMTSCVYSLPAYKLIISMI